MKQKFKFDYDYENDSLFIYNSKNKSKGCIELDNLVIDLSSKGNISSIEIFDASKFFSKISNQKISKTKLKSIIKCNLEVISQNNFFFLKFNLELENDLKISSPLMIPTVNEPSPATGKI